MNAVDILVLLAIGGCAVLGLLRGFVLETLSLIAWVFGITFGAGKLLAHAIGRRTRQSILGPVDRVLGAGFGAVKGLIGATLVFLAFSLVYDTFYGSTARRPDWLSDARTYPLLNASGQAISEFVAERRARKSAD
jgi:membrane protein required for colicin V production